MTTNNSERYNTTWTIVIHDEDGNEVDSQDVEVDDEGMVTDFGGHLKSVIEKHYEGSECEECGESNAPFDSECECD